MRLSEKAHYQSHIYQAGKTPDYDTAIFMEFSETLELSAFSKWKIFQLVACFRLADPTFLTQERG